MKFQFLYLFAPLFSVAHAQVFDTGRSYVCYWKVEEIQMDGRLEDTSWQVVPWSENFVDIEGSKMPKPLYGTKMKMIWDENYLYIGIHLLEPHIWATYSERESVIFHENDIEVFLDPDGDTHNYYELEVNALGTEWDLLLTKPYRNGGKAINSWNINGFKKAIHIEGTLNDPSNVDQYCSIEMAIPWNALSQEGSSFNAPKDGEQWRINFSRVQWQIEAGVSGYRKMINPVTEKPFPEYNWVWSPTGLIDMHMPHRWGFLQFTSVKGGEKTVPFSASPDEPIKDALRVVYELQKQYFIKHQKYALTLNELDAGAVDLEDVGFDVSSTGFKIFSPSKVDNGIWYIIEDGRIWKN